MCQFYYRELNFLLHARCLGEIEIEAEDGILTLNGNVISLSHKRLVLEKDGELSARLLWRRPVVGRAGILLFFAATEN